MSGWLFWSCVAAVVYAYAGYPLAVWLLARLRPRPAWERPASPDGPWPMVTLIIAAWNEEAVLARKLDNTLVLDYPADRLCVVVAADGSDDGTVAVAGAYADRGVTVSFHPERAGKTMALNRAVEGAGSDTDVLVFSDANNMYEPDALARLMEPLADPRVGAVTGAKMVAGGGDGLEASEGLYWRYESFIKRQETRLGSTVAATGEILAVRRELFEPFEPGTVNDDFDCIMRVAASGHRVAYQPRARSVERASATAAGETARRARIVAGRYQAMARSWRWLSPARPLLAWQVVSHKFLRPLVPFCMLGALGAGLAAVVWPPAAKAGIWRLAPPWNGVMLAAQALFYGLALAGDRLGKQGRLGRLLYLPAFLVRSNWAALVGLVRHLRGGAALWERVERRHD